MGWYGSRYGSELAFGFMLSTESGPNVSQGQFRYFLIDQTGPLAEFKSWEEAFQYLTINPGRGSVVRTEEPLEPETTREFRGPSDRSAARSGGEPRQSDPLAALFASPAWSGRVITNKLSTWGL